MTGKEAILQTLREAVAVSPDNAPLRQHLADTLLETGHYADAEREYRAALDLAARQQDDRNLGKLRIGLVQAVAGQMLGFFAELGLQFPQFPYIAHSRGWSAEDMENNERHVQDSTALHDGAAALADRCAVMARAMIEAAEGKSALVRGGRKGMRLDG